MLYWNASHANRVQFEKTYTFLDEKLIIPTTPRIEYGGSGKIQCKTSSYSYWFFNRDEKSISDLYNNIGENNVLEINFATLEVCGYYLCLGTHEQSGEQFLASVMVKIIGK